MKIKAANGLARILKTEGIPWVSCYPTNHVNNALGEEGVPILMMGEERFAVAVADGFSRVTAGKQIGVCTVMANLNAAGIQMAYGAIAQAWEDSAPLLVIAEGVGQGVEDDIGVAVADLIGDLRRRERRMHGHVDCAGAQDGVVRDQPFITILRKQRHGIAGLHAEGDQSRGCSVGLVAVVGPAQILIAAPALEPQRAVRSQPPADVAMHRGEVVGHP